MPAGRLAVLGATMELHHGLLTTEITETTESGIFSVSSVGTVVDTTAPQKSTADPVESLRMARTLAALESWLAALHVTRAERRA